MWPSIPAACKKAVAQFRNAGGVSAWSEGLSEGHGGDRDRVLFELVIAQEVDDDSDDISSSLDYTGIGIMSFFLKKNSISHQQQKVRQTSDIAFKSGETKYMATQIVFNGNWHTANV